MHKLIQFADSPLPPKAAIAKTLGFLMLCATSLAQAQLVDGGFDINPLTTLSAVINTGNTPMQPGVWGQESATLSGGLGLSSPSSPPFMLSMTASTSGIATHAAQAIDVGTQQPFASQIASGTASFTYSALFNARGSGPIGGLSMSFFNGTTYASLTGTLSSANIAVNNNASDWELHTLSGAIPVGTVSMLARVYYLNASLPGAVPGFVDDVRVSVVPEPGTWALFGVGLVACALRARRRSGQAQQPLGLRPATE